MEEMTCHQTRSKPMFSFEVGNGTRRKGGLKTSNILRSRKSRYKRKILKPAYDEPCSISACDTERSRRGGGEEVRKAGRDGEGGRIEGEEQLLYGCRAESERPSQPERLEVNGDSTPRERMQTTTTRRSQMFLFSVIYAMWSEPFYD